MRPRNIYNRRTFVCFKDKFVLFGDMFYRINCIKSVRVVEDLLLLDKNVLVMKEPAFL